MTTLNSTPLRKSEASRVFQTPQSVVREPANDDEAERRIRRSEATLDVSASSGNSAIAADNENIKMCLKLYSDNKLSKENAWSLTIIDSFAKLMSRHSKTRMQNFQVAGSTLEASTKVYGLRVDSVHTDVMRMCSELTRQTARALTNKATDQDEEQDGADNDNDQSIADGADGVDKENSQANVQQPKAKKKRARKLVSTVTKTKESINAALDTNPFTDPFFAKLNSVVGDVNSSSRLMQNIVPTKNSELRLRMNYSFWDSSEPPQLNLGDEPETYGEDETCTMHVLPIGSENPLHTLRSGYVITDAPAEDDEDDEEPRGNQSTWDQQMEDMEARNVDASLMNRSALDVHFDINAEVEPVPTGDAFIIDYDAKDIDGNDEFAEDDELALEQCKGLMRKTVLIEDMRPVDTNCSQLEYSYRPLDNISQFWAGPAHWKFKRSMRPRTTMMQSGTESELTATKDKPKQRTGRRKKAFEQDTLDDVLSVNDALFVEYNPSRPVKGITTLKSSICKKWDAKKLKLPTDYNLDRDRFDVWQYARGLTIRDNGVVGVMEHSPSEGYNTGDDQISCSADMNDAPDNDMDIEQDSPFLPLPNDVSQMPQTGIEEVNKLNATVDAISTEYKGAPDKVHKINIAYAKTAKVIDMKQLKFNCWRLINAQLQAEQTVIPPTQTASQPEVPLMPTQSDQGQINFNTLYRKVPLLLSKTMSENVTKSLAFYAVLHLANEKSLSLERQEDLTDFNIKLADL
ncbi:condensin complex subunit 2 [Anopheles ziemanni]|uniref:condensin complex subunit 2 n=1 Tax=Anopheles coustani TaxID=139045 RepID=UPI002658D6A4|nr:condensin complex subunit 2 [Anopheles coustani]XP_058171230.1 condensin complex subunit 2 [Anopheles ziemanni]